MEGRNEEKRIGGLNWRVEKERRRKVNKGIHEERRRRKEEIRKGIEIERNWIKEIERKGGKGTKIVGKERI